MSKKKLFLHIGHGKTGSSAIQSFLALNKQKLEEFGIYYPEHSSFSNAIKGHVTSGNINKLDSSYISNCIANTDLEKIIFSSEFLMMSIISNPDIFINIALEYDICVILFVRDPIDFLFSSYGQGVKRHCCIDDLDSLLANKGYEIHVLPLYLILYSLL